MKEATSILVILIFGLCLIKQTVDPPFYNLAFLYSGISIGLLSLLISYYKMRNNQQLVLNNLDFLLILSSFFIIIRACTTSNMSIMSGGLNWLLIAMLSAYVFRNMISYLNEYFVYILWIVLAILEVVLGYLQILDVIPSFNTFKLVGTFFNPAPYAGFLSTIFPLAVAILVSNKHTNHYARFLALGAIIGILPIIVLSQSRSAIIAIITGTLTIGIIRFNLFSSNRLKSATGKTLFAAMFSLVIGFSIFLYWMKPISADGRLLIWKVASCMIEEKPIFGQGIGRFPVTYMMKQSEYFASEKRSDKEISLAGQVGFPYNEFLLITVEGGLIGLIIVLYLIYQFLVLGNHTETKHKLFNRNYLKGPLVGWITFSFFSYPLFSWPLTLLLISILMFLTHERSSIFRIQNLHFRNLIYLMIIFVSLTCSVWCVIVSEKLSIWMEARQLYEIGNYKMSQARYNDVQRYFFYDGIFLQEMAKCMQQLGQYEGSNRILKYSKKLHLDPFTFTTMGTNFMHLGQYDDAEQCFNQAWYLIPNRLYPKYLLTKLLYKKGDRKKCRELARQLLDDDYRINSLALQDMLYELKIYASIKDSNNLLFSN